MTPSQWDTLLPIAVDLISQVNKEFVVIDHWSLGGGTAMMLQIDHRESHDIDIFLDDPQLLSYLDPAVQDFKFKIEPSGYSSDGSKSRRIAFGDIGEIDFIVAADITDEPFVEQQVCDHPTKLETVTEIVSKKVNYRSTTIQPRDLFDIAAAAKAGYRQTLIEALSTIKDRALETVEAAEKLSPEYVSTQVSQLMVRSKFNPLIETCQRDAITLLKEATA